MLLDHYISHGKKILTVSFNPSSTYLQTVDEKALFNALLGTLEKFATINNFDLIATSASNHIRTNRTGGLFEQALKARVQEIGAQHTLEQPQVFSYNPRYDLSQLDIIWEKS